MVVFNPAYYPRYPTTNIQPFTYRDSSSFLEIIDGLCTAHNSLIEEIIEIGKAIKQLAFDLGSRVDAIEKDYNDKIMALESKHDTDIKLLRTELTDLIVKANEEGVCFNPTNGNNAESVSKVISDVYDNVRLYGYFAKGFDTGTITAGDFDKSDKSSRNIDLYPDVTIKDDLK